MKKSIEFSETTEFSFIIYLKILQILKQQQELCDWLKMLKPWEKKD